jgi:glycosyltransferase involved in cell wall biosynthesis
VLEVTDRLLNTNIGDLHSFPPIRTFRRLAQLKLRVQNWRDQAIRIGIDALAWDSRTGYGRYCRELVSALLLLSRSHSFTLVMEPETCAPSGAEVVRFSPRGNGGGSARPLRDLVRLARTIARPPVDVWFFPSPLTFVPILSRTRMLIAIHDTLPWRYPRFIFSNRAQEFAWRIKLGLAMRQSARVITVSNHARESLAHYFKIPVSAIRVVGEAPAAVFKPSLDADAVAVLSARIGLPSDARAIVYHGALAPHKDLRTLVGTFARLSCEPQFSDVHLVLAGSDAGYKVPSIQAICHGLDRVRLPGSLDDGDLALLLNRAKLAVLPSLDEGFGLTGLEAVACGAPLVATRSSALPEMLGDGAIYFTPGDDDELYSRMVGLMTDADQRRELRKRGFERIATLSWAGAAEKLMSIFEEVLTEG